MDFPMAKSEERESCAEMELGGGTVGIEFESSLADCLSCYEIKVLFL